MAEGVVGMLIAKLGVALAKETVIFGVSLFCKEVSALKGLFGEIREAKEELESMQAYLQGAERFRGTDETTGMFVKKIRGLSFEIENVVDEFTYKLEDKYGGFAAKMRKRMERVKTWRRLALKIQEIKRRLKVADERKLRYDTRGTERNAESSGGRSMFVDQQASYFTREDFLVWIEENKKVLMQWLVEDLEQQSVVATVWGMGGVGKTTLVSHVYNVMKQGFDTAAWITVSSNYQVEAMLKIIAKEFSIADDVASVRSGCMAPTWSSPSSRLQVLRPARWRGSRHGGVTLLWQGGLRGAVVFVLGPVAAGPGRRGPWEALAGIWGKRQMRCCRMEAKARP
uniref:Uncharacterized protein n=1 Tax=Avena sativa TaxID=4498 RepID=A0ACD5TJ48_AVESA